jgi:integrase
MLRSAVADYLGAREIKPRTIYDVERIFYRNGFADWLDEPLRALTPDRIRRRHAELGKRSKAQANQAMRYLRAVFNFAIASYTDDNGEPLLAYNPVAVLSRTRSWYRVSRRQTVIQRHQLRPWFDAVVALANETARDFFLLTVLTGLRRSEGLGLTWDRVDLEGGTLTIADTKAYRRHTLPLTDFLLDLLIRRKAETPLDCPWVFADSLGRNLQNLRFALEQVERVSTVSFCVHDLRRTFATVADSLDIPAYALKRLLNHSTGSDVTAGYIIADVERLRVPMQKITDYFLKAGGLRDGAAVVAFARKYVSDVV